jgi:Restriction Enzyme Adenine Methylase Associated
LAEPQDKNTELAEELALRAVVAARHVRNAPMSEAERAVAEERRDWLEATRHAVHQHREGTSWWVDTAYDLLDECDALAAEIERLVAMIEQLVAEIDQLRAHNDEFGAAAAEAEQLREGLQVTREALARIGDEQHPRTALDFSAAISIARAALALPGFFAVEDQKVERETSPLPADALQRSQRATTSPSPEAMPAAEAIPAVPGTRQASTRYGVTMQDLLDAGLVRPGTKLRKRYLGQCVVATVEPEGRVRFGRQVYNSLTSAARAARVAVEGPARDGRRYATNGWTFWEHETEDGASGPIDVLRYRYLSSQSNTPG